MKQTSMGRAKRVLLLALLLLSAGCGQRDTIATTLVTPTSIDPTVLAAALATTRTIYISDDWVGLDGSQYAHWNLERVDGRASGQAKLSAKARSGVAHEAAPTIDIPSLSVDNFLQMLATAQYEPGVRGLASRTTITLSTDAGMVEFAFKTISGDFIRPGEKERIGWSLVFKGQDYLIASDLPNSALYALDPYLKRDVLRQLHKDAQAAFNARLTLCLQPSSRPYTPARSPAPIPISNGDRLQANDFVNLADRLAIRQPQSIAIEDADYFAKKKITDPQQLASLIALLDQPLLISPTSTFNLNEAIGLDIATAEHQARNLYYMPATYLLVVIEQGDGFGVLVPPEFPPTISKILCTR